MNKMFLSILMFSLFLPGTFYIGIDSSSDWELTDADGLSVDGDFKDDSISLGYNHPVYQNEQMTLEIGLSSMISPLKDGSGHKISISSLYLLPSYSFTNELLGWVSIGYGNYSGDDIPLSGFNWKPEGGTMYGFGIQYNLSNTLNCGLAYMINSGSLETSSLPIDFKFDVSRVTFFTGYSF